MANMDELKDRARELDIDGFSTMNKAELEAAIAEAEAEADNADAEAENGAGDNDVDVNPDNVPTVDSPADRMDVEGVTKAVVTMKNGTKVMVIRGR